MKALLAMVLAGSVLSSRVIETKIPCTYSGICCQWSFGLKYKCGFSLACVGERVERRRFDSVVGVDGGVEITETLLDAGTCR